MGISLKAHDQPLELRMALSAQFLELPKLLEFQIALEMPTRVDVVPSERLLSAALPAAPEICGRADTYSSLRDLFRILAKEYFEFSTAGVERRVINPTYNPVSGSVGKFHREHPMRESGTDAQAARQRAQANSRQVENSDRGRPTMDQLFVPSIPAAEFVKRLTVKTQTPADA